MSWRLVIDRSSKISVLSFSLLHTTIGLPEGEELLTVNTKICLQKIYKVVSWHIYFT